ncbi:MAG: tRNA (guanosine(46)-N7)-methyltransferase TrmB [Propionibacteriaceae bacterium]|nr:tRNA (guanosine(46)-N7)-methyltransferase TrmB [Propionibacteriaceae bacterium]
MDIIPNPPIHGSCATPAIGASGIILDHSRRSVVSYVRRGSRMTASQRTWMQTYGPRWIVDVAQGDLATMVAPQPVLDLPQVFGRKAPLIIEIGSGHGETLAHAAGLHPEINFLGFEVFDASIASTLGKLAAAGLENVRLVVADAVSGLTHLIGTHTVEEIWVFFPDPWQKKRHHKRRLVRQPFVDLAADKLILGGVLRLATDWDSYAESMSAVLDSDTRFQLSSTARFTTRPITKFESRALTAGRAIHDFAYARKELS